MIAVYFFKKLKFFDKCCKAQIFSFFAGFFQMSSADNLQTISSYINRYLDLTLKKDEEDLILGQVQTKQQKK